MANYTLLKGFCIHTQILEDEKFLENLTTDI